MISYQFGAELLVADSTACVRKATVNASALL